MKVAIYGGTFDPVHLGHMCLIEYLSRCFDQVLVVPARLSPFKSSVIASDAQRLQMLQIALCKFGNVQIDEQELLRQQPSYTVDTVECIASKYVGAQLYLCIGQDHLSSLDRWHRFDKLQQLCSFLVFRRQYFLSSEPCQLNNLAIKQPKSDAKYSFVDVVLPAISSSVVRVAGCTRAISEWLDKGVYSFVKSNGLYSDYQRYCSALYSEKYYLTESRISHIERTVLNGANLAAVCSADVQKVAIAMYMHDIAKCLSIQKLEQMGIPTAEVAILPPSIQHAMAGRLIAENHFGVQDVEILDAIQYHTTGRPNMSLLEIIVYLADATEYGRLQELECRGLKKDSLIEIINLAFEGKLHQALLLALRDSVNSLKGRNLQVFYLTQQALDFYEKLDRAAF